MVANPSTDMPHLLCLTLEFLFTIVAANRAVSDLAVALGRYNIGVFSGISPVHYIIFSGCFTSAEYSHWRAVALPEGQESAENGKRA